MKLESFQSSFRAVFEQFTKRFRSISEQFSRNSSVFAPIIFKEEFQSNSGAVSLPFSNSFRATFRVNPGQIFQQLQGNFTVNISDKCSNNLRAISDRHNFKISRKLLKFYSFSIFSNFPIFSNFLNFFKSLIT